MLAVEAPRPGRGQGRAVARDARDQRRRLRDPEREAVDGAGVAGAALLRAAVGERPSPAPRRRARRRSPAGRRAGARSGARARSRRSPGARTRARSPPPGGASKAAQLGGDQRAAGRSAAPPRCRRAGRPRSSCAPRGRAASQLPAGEPGEQREVRRAGDRKQLGRALDRPERPPPAPRSRPGRRRALRGSRPRARPARRRRAGGGSGGRSARRRSPRGPGSRRSAGSRATPPSCRRPRLPMKPSSSTHGTQPASVNTVKRQNGIRATPAGSEMKVRMIGSIRVKKTVASPWRSNQRSAQSRCLRLMWISWLCSSSSTGRSSRPPRRSTSRRRCRAPPRRRSRTGSCRPRRR